MATEIDNLQVKITANAVSATNALKSLSTALNKVKTALTGMKNGVSVTSSLSKSLNDMNRSLNGISTKSIGKLQSLATALDDYAEAVKKVKSLRNGSITQSVKDAQRAVAATKNKTSTSTGASGKISDTSESLKKIGDETEKAGEKAKKANGAFEKFWGSIKRIALYRAIRSAMKAIGEAFETGLKNAYYYSKQTGDLSNLAKTLDTVKSKTSQMVNQLGAFWGEIKQFLAPAIEWIAEKIQQITEYLTELFAALNGDTYYQRAKLVATSWDDAADSVKKYKHQLLGLDELNNLSKKEDSGNNAVTKAKEEFEDILVRPEFQAVGQAWQSVKASVEEALNGIYGCLIAPIGMAAIGALLLFTGHTFLGLGLVFAGVTWTVTEIIIHWDELRGELEGAFKKYWELFTIGSVAAVAIGALLIFTQHYIPGIALVLAGTALLTATIAFNWSELRKKIKTAFKKYKGLFVIGSVAAVAIGALLIFTQHYIAGIALVIAGTGLLAATIAFNWTDLKTAVKSAFKKYKALFAIGSVACVALGALLLFTPKFPLGIGLILAGISVGAATIAFNWDDIYNGLVAAWTKIKNYLDNTIFAFLRDFAAGVEELLGWDMNGDGKIGNFKIGSKLEDLGLPKEPAKVAGGGSAITFKGTEDNGGYPRTLSPGEIPSITVNGVTYESETYKKKHTNNRAANAFEDDQLVKVKAIGGIVNQGSLFYAGEAGAEFVGNIGSTSAVANTGQMTDAIYKAAYMGMSKALAENGGNGLAGFEPATTDDLFIAMRKKASNYNRMTGNSAFA